MFVASALTHLHGFFCIIFSASAPVNHPIIEEDVCGKGRQKAEMVRPDFRVMVIESERNLFLEFYGKGDKNRT